MSRRENDTPRYVVLGILFVIALHTKLQTLVEDGEIEETNLQQQSRHSLDGTETGDPRSLRKSLHNKISNISTDDGRQLSNKMNDVASIIDKLRIALDGKRYVRKDVFTDSPNDGKIPQPKVSADCDKLFEGDEDVIEYTSFVQENRTKLYTLDNSYEFPKDRCSEFIKSRHYITEGVTKIEQDFPIAFSIMMFKDVEQTERLLRTIYRPQNYYCIHVDAKSGNGTFLAMQSIANCFPNVILASHRSDVRWGTFTVLEPEVTCMRDLTRWRWKYFINLTGQEVALKTNFQIVKILKSFDGANDVEGLPR